MSAAALRRPAVALALATRRSVEGDAVEGDAWEALVDELSVEELRLAVADLAGLVYVLADVVERMVPGYPLAGLYAQMGLCFARLEEHRLAAEGD